MHRRTPGTSYAPPPPTTNVIFASRFSVSATRNIAFVLPPLQSNGILSLSLSPGVFFLGGGSTSGGKSGIKSSWLHTLQKAGLWALVAWPRTYTYTEDEEDRREANIQGLSVLYLRRQYPSVIVSTRFAGRWIFNFQKISGERGDGVEELVAGRSFLGVREGPSDFLDWKSPPVLRSSKSQKSACC
jgi:hypothetical protein